MSRRRILAWVFTSATSPVNLDDVCCGKQSNDGDIIDCVNSVHQPAFDHPALRNHSLQASPAAFPKNSLAEEVLRNKTGEPPPQLWHQTGQSCPHGTIPIRRTSAKDVLRAGSLKEYMMKKTGPSSPISPPSRTLQTQADNSHEHAIGYMRGDMLYGAQATLNVWNPTVQEPSEFSLSQIWVLAGTFNNDLNSIEAGWQVSPLIYGDSNPRLFIYWTADAYQGTGCYNLLCSGFVQTSNAIAIGAAITPLSSAGGSQYDISILIWKDPSRGNWWMQFGEDHLVGYWPASLFTHLATSASMLEWGGEVVNSRPGGRHTATRMGSGQFPEKGFGQASYLRNIKFVDANNVLKTPLGMRTLAEHPACYNIQKGANAQWGAFFFYGGPGQNADCP
uniref:Neprosin PEP catalytic domain-containing protein n=1 Tax=Physcomitrium patens TaxID=3218 RepID=A0A2K1KHL5_PHYPA|nr:uncharacterized protein LOC112283283 isoform X2 [Physcomitrium patens]PNR53267.1 hypothetical protein PHYPA_009643 [Physcomitrium patens]|eukprot:XP_024377583.1 uncharacterized protein LOC112283283 isoform X2 [Physcomitrella patens]